MSSLQATSCSSNCAGVGFAPPDRAIKLDNRIIAYLIVCIYLGHFPLFFVAQSVTYQWPSHKLTIIFFF